jgi:glycerophosphoryl diester phosphodiesterase
VPPAGTGDPIAVARSLGARLLVAPRHALGPGLADAARAAGLLLATYTVDSPADLEPLLPLGLHAFATDYPDRFAGHAALR